MHKIIAVTLILFHAGSISAAAPEVDFDGKSKVIKNIISVLDDVAAKDVAVPSSPGKRLMMEYAVQTDSGGWSVVEPIWKDEKLYLKTEPGSVFTLTLWCSNNYDELWGFNMKHEMLPWGHGHPTVNQPYPLPPRLTYGNNTVLPNPLEVYPIAPTARYVVDIKAPRFAARINLNIHSTPCGNSDVAGVVEVKNDVKLGPMPEGDVTKRVLFEAYYNRC